MSLIIRNFTPLSKRIITMIAADAGLRTNWNEEIRIYPLTDKVRVKYGHCCPADKKLYGLCWRKGNGIIIIYVDLSEPKEWYSTVAHELKHAWQCCRYMPEYIQSVMTAFQDQPKDNPLEMEADSFGRAY